ncbi:retropepsin-like aspartic protease [Allorhodopirellula solitaria]|uniref:retropepsin-like aspartic protease n=1 Tax=Allorhodopirellula solitaria TaxID=2527987 RepID=UPI001FE55865|nr:retropepsin-like aspartic protease [Allorhodopirellula solitaria]
MLLCGSVTGGLASVYADGPTAAASDSNTTAPSVTYSAAVVEKAETVLLDAGLRRSGKSIQSTDAAELSRTLSGLGRERRELQLQQKAFTVSQNQGAMFENEINQLKNQDGELNLQLARVAGIDVAKNNRLVALINATRTKIEQLKKQHGEHKELIQKARAKINTAEQGYAESVFQVRKQIDELEDTIQTQLENGQVQIAISVMNANFDVPKDVDAEQVLHAIENRFRDFEQEVFQETIELNAAPSGALYTMVSVNQQSVRMIIDSGATLVTLPADAAKELQIVVPDDAPILRLQLANGQQISGRRVKLSSVRVGQFEAEDVDAVVLEAIPLKAEPLLGLSYLNRYKFELDSAGKTLGLLRVDDADSPDAQTH